MKTLLYCTIWAPDQGAMDRRLGRWIEHHAKLEYPCDIRLAAIGDGIATGIHWPAGQYTRVNLHPHLGRPAHLDYPGWWRSFTHGIVLARALECQRLWHVESDFFIASQRMIKYMASVTSGWESMWCPRHNFPETAVQIIAADRFPALSEIRSRWATFAGQHAESVIQFDKINKEMVGDRYGEVGIKPQDVQGLDFYGQLGDGEPTWFERVMVPNENGGSS